VRAVFAIELLLDMCPTPCGQFEVLSLLFIVHEEKIQQIAVAA
jgi:hypothetical protein